MKTTRFFILAAGILFAMAITISCSSDGGEGEENLSSSSVVKTPSSSSGSNGNDTGSDAWALLEDTAWLKTGETYLRIRFLNPYGSFKSPVFNARKSSGNEFTEFTEIFQSFSESKVVLYSKGSFNYSISGDNLTILNSTIEDYDLDGVYLKQAGEVLAGKD